jgi:uncharacterized protein (DUF302 family)
MHPAVLGQVDGRSHRREVSEHVGQARRVGSQREDGAVVDRVGMDVQNATPAGGDGVGHAAHLRRAASFGDVWDREQRHRGVTVWEMTEYGYTVTVPEGYDEAITRTRVAVRGEGFSILTEMHVGGVLGPEAGTERQYLIIGAWNPAITRDYTEAQIRVALQLPCNFVVQEEGSGALVAALDPGDTLESADADSVRAVDGARDALGRVLERIAASQ